MMDQPPPLRIVRHLLQIYSSSYVKEEADAVYSLNLHKIMQFYALNIIKQNNAKPIKKEEFIKQWNAQCPSECRPKLSQLQGIVIEKPKGFDTYLHYFPASELSEDIPARFTELFAFQPKWTLENISPYLRFVLFQHGIN